MLTMLEKQSMVSNGKIFSKYECHNDTVHLFNRTIKKILPNIIPHEIITCDDRDPSWIDS